MTTTAAPPFDPASNKNAMPERQQHEIEDRMKVGQPPQGIGQASPSIGVQLGSYMSFQEAPHPFHLAGAQGMGFTGEQNRIGIRNGTQGMIGNTGQGRCPPENDPFQIHASAGARDMYSTAILAGSA
jgi:hypothetical protein